MEIGPEAKAGEYFSRRFASLMKFDLIRANQLLEVCQYSLLYFGSAFVVGAGLNMLFPAFDEKRGTGRLAVEVVFELIVLTVAVFYLRKFVKIFPFFFQLRVPGSPDFVPYKTSEYQGEIALAIIFIGLQFKLVKKIDLLASRVYAQLLGHKVMKEVK